LYYTACGNYRLRGEKVSDNVVKVCQCPLAAPETIAFIIPKAGFWDEESFESLLEASFESLPEEEAPFDPLLLLDCFPLLESESEDCDVLCFECATAKDGAASNAVAATAAIQMRMRNPPEDVGHHTTRAAGMTGARGRKLKGKSSIPLCS
jgi:hypothetical protein